MLPFWQHVWPQSKTLISKDLANPLARLAISARNKFPDALAKVRDWLLPPDYPGSVIRHLHSKLCGTFPEDALDLLDKIVGQAQAPQTLGEYILEIGDVRNELRKDLRLKRLHLRVQQ